MLSRTLIILGAVAFLIGAWLVTPLVRAYATDQVVWGRVLDVVIVPAGEGLARFQVAFEYPVPGGDGRTWAQGSAQADARLDLHADPRIPIAKAISLRQSLLEASRRRVFLSTNRPPTEPFIISDAVAGGLGYRQGLFIALAGSLLITMGITARRKREV